MMIMMYNQLVDLGLSENGPSNSWLNDSHLIFIVVSAVSAFSDTPIFI